MITITICLLYWQVYIQNIQSLICYIVDITQPRRTYQLVQIQYNDIFVQTGRIYIWIFIILLQLFEFMTFSLLLRLSQAEIRYLPNGFHSYFMIWIIFSLSFKVLFWFIHYRYYSATIIKMSGVKSESAAIWLSAVTAATNFVFTFVGLYLVERIGRRSLTIGSLAGIGTKHFDTFTHFESPIVLKSHNSSD